MENRTTILGQALVSWRESEGKRLGLKGRLPIAEASSRIGISKQLLIDIEKGRRLPTQQRLLAAIYRATGLRPEDWWEAA